LSLYTRSILQRISPVFWNSPFLELAQMNSMSIVDEILNRALELSQPKRAALAHRFHFQRKIDHGRL